MASALGFYLLEAGDGYYLGGLLDGAGDWWNGLNGWQQVAVGAGVAALVVVSGGSLGLALGVSGVVTYGLAHAHGAATFSRDPVGATLSYTATTTPMEALVDTGEFALTFAPGNFAGAAAGRIVRDLGQEVARDPSGWLATRQALLREPATSDAGVIDIDTLLGRSTVPLADGTGQQALSRADEAAELARYNDMPPSAMSARGAQEQFQRSVYGDNERILRTPDGHRVIPDGFTPTYGAIGDAKLVRANGSSFYLPESMGSPKLTQLAMQRMDEKLAGMAAAADSLGGRRVVELTTNSLQAARFIEARMSALGIHGYVRIVE